LPPVGRAHCNDAAHSSVLGPPASLVGSELSHYRAPTFHFPHSKAIGVALELFEDGHLADQRLVTWQMHRPWKRPRVAPEVGDGFSPFPLLGSYPGPSRCWPRFTSIAFFLSSAAFSLRLDPTGSRPFASPVVKDVPPGRCPGPLPSRTLPPSLGRATTTHYYGSYWPVRHLLFGRARPPTHLARPLILPFVHGVVSRQNLFRSYWDP